MLGIIASSGGGDIILPGDTGWVFPGTVSGSWTNINNVKATTGYASETLAPYLYSPDSSTDITATNFDFSAIPDGAVLTRIYTRVRWYRTNSITSNNAKVSLMFSGATNGNQSDVVPLTSIVGTYEDTQDSAANADWGTSVTLDDIKNDSSFGMRFGSGVYTEVYYTNVNLWIQYLQMKIEWEAP